jgi:hypothetical protein
MTETDNNRQPRRGGKRPGATAAATQSLGSVRVTDDELQAYSDAAESVEKSRADWVRDILNRAARRALIRK